MALLSFNKKAWQKARPKAAEGSGVGKAIDLVEKAAKKSRKLEDVHKTLEELTGLKLALLSGKSKIKDRRAEAQFIAQVDVWIREVDRLHGEQADERRRLSVVALLQAGDEESARLSKDVLKARQAVGKAHQAEAPKAATARNPALREKNDKVCEVVITKIGTKHTAAGMKTWLTRRAGAGYISAKFLAAGDVEDPDHRSTLEAQYDELIRERDAYLQLYG